MNPMDKSMFDLEEYLNNLRNKYPGCTVKEFVQGIARADLELEFLTLLLICNQLDKDLVLRKAAAQ